MTLTLVSLAGDIRIGPTARRVEAYLVAAAGKIDVAASGLVLSGGAACRELDFAALKGLPEPPVLEHADETDPARAGAPDSLRAYYGGDDRVVVGGAQ